MKTEINQKISSLIDGELSSSEEEKLLLKISKDPKLINKLNRYQTVNHSFKNNSLVIVNKGFLDKVKEEIEQEPHFFLPNQKSKERKVSSLQMTSIAIAASTVIATVLISQNPELPSNTVQPTDPFIAQQFVKPKKANAVVTAEIQTDIAESELTKGLKELQQGLQHERLKAYLQAHTDNLYTYDSLNFQPYARVVSQD
ncbi:MAG: hypothetical protein KAH20_13375 [Methylococcales bacterium]|nr:hypothetical protein [Methylococcales bacterium]